MTDKVRKQLGEPQNELEEETLAYIESLITEMIGEDILGKHLDLASCLEFCFEKGKKFEVKSGNSGCAKISEEQHFAWVREYFGIEETKKKSETASLDIDFDNLFD